MRRRRLLVGLGAVALLGVAGLLIWSARPTPAVTWENFRLLRMGMSPKDVEALLGEPHDVYEFPTATDRFWCGEEVVVLLSFDADLLGRGLALPPRQDFARGARRIPPPLRSPPQHHRLWAGMPAKDVETVLGVGKFEFVVKMPDGGTNKDWWSEEVRIHLHYDPHNELTYGQISSSRQNKSALPCLPQPESFFDRIRRLLHL
jgi:hypothetical protein